MRHHIQFHSPHDERKKFIYYACSQCFLGQKNTQLNNPESIFGERRAGAITGPGFFMYNKVLIFVQCQLNRELVAHMQLLLLL